MRNDGWVVTDGAAGNENQALALARALGIEPSVFRLDARVPWHWFAPHLTAGAKFAFGTEFARCMRDGLPVLAIGCGRQGALATRLLKQRGGNSVRVVQILDPRVDRTTFDAIVVPEHDGVHGDNVLVTRGALNAVDDEWLAQARSRWPTLCALPGPRTLLLLGGPNHALSMNGAYWSGLLTQLKTLRAHDGGGTLLVSSSRRTPDRLRDAARADLAAWPSVQWHGDHDGPNPYAGLLAAAHRIVVTPDSVNMLSEACATRVPVFVHRPTPLRGKIGAFVERLVADGRVHVLGASWPGQEPIEPLRETARVAAEIARRFALA